MDHVGISAYSARNKLWDEEVSLGEKITREIRRRAETNHDMAVIRVYEVEKSKLQNIIEDLELKNFEVSVSNDVEGNQREILIYW